jgi:hypothetical protein
VASQPAKARISTRVHAIVSWCGLVGGLTSLGLLVAGHREIAAGIALAVALLIAVNDLIKSRRNKKIALPTIPEPLAQELKAHLERGDRRTVLVRLRTEYPHLSLGKAVELMGTLQTVD